MGGSKLSRANLARTNIFYNEHVYSGPEPTDILPSHVKALQETILDFSWAIRNQGVLSRCNFYHDAVVSNSDKVWTLFREKSHQRARSGLDLLKVVSQPQPDCCFFLPMYQSKVASQMSHVSKSASRLWHQNSIPSIVEPFSWSLFQELFEHGLRPTPFGVLGQNTKKPKEPSTDDLKCYPWLIVEFKHNDDSYMEEVCCQGANGSACAVNLNRIAAKYATKQAQDEQVPPIPVITTVGAKVKVWIMYFSRDFKAPYDVPTKKKGDNIKEGYLMRCIWEGNMTNLRHVVEFKLLLENTYTWATRVFKPLLGSYIYQWKLETRRTDDRGISAASTTAQRDLDVSKRLTPRVEDILQRYATTAINPNEPSRATAMMVGYIQQLIKAERDETNRQIELKFAERMKGLNIGSKKLQSRVPTVDSFTYTRNDKRSYLDEILPTTELNDGEYHEDEFLGSEYSEDSQGAFQCSDDSEESEDSKDLGDTEEESEDKENSQPSPRVHLATPVQERGLRRSLRLATPEPAADQPKNRQRAPSSPDPAKLSSLPQSPSPIQSKSRRMTQRVRPIRVRAKLRPKSRDGEASQQAHLRFERCQSSPPRGLDFPSP
ncbi:uncharacterized protein FTOL_01502 [Fusarium torulosum]|uniref:Uncharacterized protein n=1 Tax=Fusarium torulosum TaxID=33205 RepID=A0AAE8SDX4_9HYPO|nr:uncharacterized protein FTOL_01502 [Fusarium torulosum]